jgi:MFS family permease
VIGRLRGLPSDVWIVFVTTLLNRVGTMALPFLALYLAEHLGYPAQVAGFAITAYGFGALIVAPVAGRLADRVGGLRVMRTSLALSGLLLFMLPLVKTAALMFPLIVLWGMAADAVRPASLSALTRLTNPDQRRIAIALNRLAINLGMSIGPAAGGLIAAVSFPVLFIVDGATSIAAAAWLTFVLARPAFKDISGTAARRDTPGLRRDRQTMIFLVAILLTFVVFTQTDAAMPLFMVRDLHLPVTYFGAVFVLNTLLIICLEVPLNLAMIRWSHRASLSLGIVLIAIGFGILAGVTTTVGVAVSVVVWTFGEMIFLPTAAAHIASEAPEGRRGQYLGAYSMTYSVALMIGPWAGAVALDRFGATSLWLAMPVCGLCAAWITWAASPGKAMR